MISICLCTALLFPSVAQEPLADLGTGQFEIGHLTGADELDELREAILEDGLAASVRRDSLDRYTAILKRGQVEDKAMELASNVRHFVEPAAGPDFEVQALSGSKLSVSGGLAQRRWVSEFLKQTAKANFSGDMVDIRTEIYRMPPENREALTDGRSGLAMGPKELQAMKAKLAAIQGVEKVSSPRMLLFLGSKGEMSVLNETAYIRDFELTVLPDLAREILDPVVDVISEGFTLQVRTLAVADDKLLVSTDFSSSSLKRPIADAQRKLGPSYDEVTIQLPELKSIKGSAKFELENDAAIVLSTIDPGFENEEPMDLLVIVRVGLVPSDAADSGK